MTSFVIPFIANNLAKLTLGGFGFESVAFLDPVGVCLAVSTIKGALSMLLFLGIFAAAAASDEGFVFTMGGVSSRWRKTVLWIVRAEIGFLASDNGR